MVYMLRANVIRVIIIIGQGLHVSKIATDIITLVPAQTKVPGMIHVTVTIMSVTVITVLIGTAAAAEKLRLFWRFAFLCHIAAALVVGTGFRLSAVLFNSRAEPIKVLTAR